MAAVSWFPSHGSSSDVSCCPPLKGMDSDDRSSSSRSGSTGGDPGDLVQRVSDLVFFGCRSSSVQPLEEAKDARSFCSDVDDAAVLPKGSDRNTSSSALSVPVLKDSSSMDPLLIRRSLFRGRSSETPRCSSMKTRSAVLSLGFSLVSLMSRFLTLTEKSSPSPSGRRLRLSSMFGSFSTTVLLVLVAVVLCSSPVLGKICESLDEVDKNELMKCTLPLIRIKGNETSKLYPIIDFSNYTQDEMDLVLMVRDHSRKPEKDKVKLFTGRFVMKESTNVTSLKFKFFIELSVLEYNQSLTLENNLNLVNVTIAIEMVDVVNCSIPFVVKGNKLLSEESITSLKNISCIDENSYIQDFGECILGPLVQDLSELDHCYYVNGDLKIGKHTDSNTKIGNNFLTNITGCLEVKGSDFSNLDFMAKITTVGCTIEIADNKNLCLHPEELKKLKGRLPVEYKNNKDCKGECTSDFFLREKDKSCAIINGSITINGVSEEDDLSHFSTVEKIIGFLVIAKTTLKKIDMFPNLRSVDFSQKSELSLDAHRTHPAIFIWGNKNLSSFSLPNLAEVLLVDGFVAEGLAMEENNKTFIMGDEDLWKYGNITKIRLPMKDPPPIVIRRPGSNGTVYGSKENETIVIHEEGISEVTLAVSISVPFGILIAVALVVLTTVCVISAVRKSRKKKKLRAMRLEMKNRQREFPTFTNTTEEDSCSGGMLQIDEKLAEMDKSAKTLMLGVGEHRLPNGLQEFFYQVDVINKDDYRTIYNFDCTLSAENTDIQIKRDRLEAEDWKLRQNEEFWDREEHETDPVHDIPVYAYTIYPRREKTDVFKYHQEGRFDPVEFIKAVMSSSAIELSAKTMSDALDYCLDHKYRSFGNCLQINEPCFIIGDTHGSLIDLQALFSIEPPERYPGEEQLSDEYYALPDDKTAQKRCNDHPLTRCTYVFAGDYCDRGHYDLVCFVFLCVLAKYGKKVHLLRGNHDWIFYGEEEFAYYTHIEQHYGPAESDRTREQSIRYKFDKLRTKLPLCAIINKNIFVSHGGIAKTLIDPNQSIYSKVTSCLLDIDVPNYPGTPEAYRKDPAFAPLYKYENDEKARTKKKKKPEDENSKEVTMGCVDKALHVIQSLVWPDPGCISYYTSGRGAGGYFAQDDIDTFLKENGLRLIVRAHESVGFAVENYGRVVTVFANYCTSASVVGVPYMFSHEKKFASELKSNPLIGMLRVNRFNEVSAVLLYHRYDGIEKQLANGPSEWKPNYEAEFFRRQRETNQLMKEEEIKREKQKEELAKSSNTSNATNSKAGEKKSDTASNSKAEPPNPNGAAAAQSKTDIPQIKAGAVKSSSDAPKSNAGAPQTKAEAPKSGSDAPKSKSGVPASDAPKSKQVEAASKSKAPTDTPSKTAAPPPPAPTSKAAAPVPTKNATPAPPPSKNAPPTAADPKKTSQEKPKSTAK